MELAQSVLFVVTRSENALIEIYLCLSMGEHSWQVGKAIKSSAKSFIGTQTSMRGCLLLNKDLIPWKTNFLTLCTDHAPSLQ